MTRTLELADIQGNIVRAYGKNNYPKARYFFLHIDDASAGRKFVEAVRRRTTTAARWDKDPKKLGKPGGAPLVTLNIAFTYYGLLALKLSTRTMQAMPAEFIDGMRKRAYILGDSNLELPKGDLNEDYGSFGDFSRPGLESMAPPEEPSWDEKWDPIWKKNVGFSDDAVHIWMSMNSRVKPLTDEPVEELEQQTQWLRDLCDEVGGVRILATNGAKGDQEYQSASAIFAEIDGLGKIPTPQEHFGFSDGIGDPIFEGQLRPEDEKKAVPGRGKWMWPEKGWEPLATGEFVLGYPDESQELPPAAAPDEFMRNGSFLVYRKLHENVGSYRSYFAAEAEKFAKAMDISKDQAEVTLQAKAVGRWPDGVPLARKPTYEEWQAFRDEIGLSAKDPIEAGKAMIKYRASSDIVDFKYGDDMHGYKCPNGAHLRRMNTRDYLDPLNDMDGKNPDATTQLNKRRRILRRGLPYGASKLGVGSDETEQGIAFMVICANIFRQFEFVQQQWIQYGLDFNQGNNTCPMLGNHSIHKKYTIPSDPKSGKPPYICDNLPQFVETRGGDYFFIPSLTALRMMSMGVVDPT